jgi:hypothetical protein
MKSRAGSSSPRIPSTCNSSGTGLCSSAGAQACSSRRRSAAPSEPFTETHHRPWDCLHPSFANVSLPVAGWGTLQKGCHVIPAGLTREVGRKLIALLRYLQNPVATCTAQSVGRSSGWPAPRRVGVCLIRPWTAPRIREANRSQSREISRARNFQDSEPVCARI